jgi:phosphoribosylaminoimidazole-succinocarboxamide synthase
MHDTALPHLYTGKVRELYEIGHDQLLMVATDRISVFDVVLPDEIPDKGRVLTGLSSFWFDKTKDIVPNHVVSCDPSDFPETAGHVAGRATRVKATRPVPIECVVRGYVMGGGWSEYQQKGTVGGFAVPKGLQQAEKLPAPLFTPSTKADQGHDIPLDADDAIALVGRDVYDTVKEASLAL